jgi:hypothetical protein
MVTVASLALALALAPPPRGPGPDSVVTRARAALRPLTDSVALRNAGYVPIGFGAGTRDLTPFQGQHWIEIGRFLINPPVDLGRPNFAIFLPVGDSLIPVGVAYSRRIPADSAPPTEIAGTPAPWHAHAFCRAIPGEGNVLADGPDDCRARGGTPAPNQITMVHAWTVPNPDGAYGHDNPALPFLATRLTPPEHPTRDDRLFAIALGESYGAKLPVAHRIERDARRDTTRAGVPLGLEPWRDTLRALVPRLREAEARGDGKRFAALRRQAVDAWGALAARYREIAATPAVRARFDVELEQLLGGEHHHHGGGS